MFYVLNESIYNPQYVLNFLNAFELSDYTAYLTRKFSGGD